MNLDIAPLPEPPAPPVPGEDGLGALSTERGNLPLDAVDVRAAVAGLTAGVTIEQAFRNPHDVPLEATYVFPLPDRAAVTSLRMEAADRVVEGVLKERGRARQEYATAVAEGRRAAIAEEDRPDVFTMRVGNIMPGERVAIRLSLDQPLPYEDGEATFRFPLVVAPRYIPGAPIDGEQAGSGVRPDTGAVPDASRISPPVLLPGFPDPVRLSITVDIDPAGLELLGIRSALHVVAEDGSGEDGTGAGRTTVRLEPGERLNRDFILRLAYASLDAPALALAPDREGDEGTFTLTLLPGGRAAPAPRDVVLVLDRSGSMRGWKMVAARRAAARIVDTLTGADRFAVLSFDNTVERPPRLGDGLAEATDRNRFRAVEHLAGIQARGGTEMTRPLEEACGLLADPGRDRVLVLVTDGQIGNEDQLLSRLGSRMEGIRIHTVGIDRAVNAGFLHRLADAGGGRCELVESEDRLDEAMEAVHHRITAPLVTGLRLEPSGLELDPGTVAPRRIGALFPGVPLVVAGRYRGKPSGSVTVRGTAPDGSEWTRRADATEADAPAAAAIWARAHLRDLEDRYATGGPDDLEQRIVETSLRFNVLSRFTAFVAVDSRVVAEPGRPHQIVQPVEAPDGWANEVSRGAPPAPGSAPMTAGAAAMPARAPMSPPPAPSGRPPVDDLDVPDFLGVERSAPPRRRAAPRAQGPAGRPGAPRPSAPSQDPLSELRALLDGLRQEVPGRDRADHLASTVEPALAEALRHLEQARPTASTVAPLQALAEDLRTLRRDIANGTVPSDRINGLWDRAIDALTTFLQKTDSPPTPRRPFWKRA